MHLCPGLCFVMTMLIVLMVVMRISVIQEMIQIELRSVIHLSAGE